MSLFYVEGFTCISPLSLSAYMHISKTIEACRVHLFDIVTQYKAIFPDDDTMLLTAHSSYTGKQADGTLFCGWLNSKVKKFMLYFLHTILPISLSLLS